MFPECLLWSSRLYIPTANPTVAAASILDFIKVSVSYALVFPPRLRGWSATKCFISESLSKHFPASLFHCCQFSVPLAPSMSYSVSYIGLAPTNFLLSCGKIASFGFLKRLCWDSCGQKAMWDRCSGGGENCMRLPLLSCQREKLRSHYWHLFSCASVYLWCTPGTWRLR